MITIEFLNASGSIIDKYEHRLHSADEDVAGADWAVRFAYGLLVDNPRHPPLTGVTRVKVVNDVDGKFQEMTYAEFCRIATIR